MHGRTKDVKKKIKGGKEEEEYLNKCVDYNA